MARQFPQGRQALRIINDGKIKEQYTFYIESIPDAFQGLFKAKLGKMVVLVEVKCKNVCNNIFLSFLLFLLNIK